MARALRIELAGGFYHVTSRGDRREDIYHSERDRMSWLDLLGEVCDRFNWRCYAWCQMTNHYHLVVETVEPNLSAGMRHLNGVYTQRINRHHGRVGHVFQGRYKAMFVDRDAYLLELVRYVSLNPVRAQAVASPEQWAWSSYRAMAGLTQGARWLGTEWVLSHFGKHRDEVTMRFVDYVRAGVGLPSIWSALRHQVFLGPEEFVRTIQTRIDGPPATLAEIPRIQRRPPPPSLEQLRIQTPRVDAMIRAYASGAYTLQAIAQAFGVHYSTVSRAVKRAQSSDTAPATSGGLPPDVPDIRPDQPR